MNLIERFRAGLSAEALAEALDAMDGPTRLAQLRAFDGHDQARLFELAAGRPTTVADFVPEETAPLTQVIHDGRNSLPAFRFFQKRFCRSSRARSPEVLFGYNEQALRLVTGPGYFVAREDAFPDGGPRTVVIDYHLQPDEKPPSWPEVRPNSERLSRFVYQGTRDWMWRVSRHVTIGRARRESGWMSNWFWLCRAEP